MVYHIDLGRYFDKCITIFKFGDILVILYFLIYYLKDDE